MARHKREEERECEEREGEDEAEEDPVNNGRDGRENGMRKRDGRHGGVSGDGMGREKTRQGKARDSRLISQTRSPKPKSAEVGEGLPSSLTHTQAHAHTCRVRCLLLSPVSHSFFLSLCCWPRLASLLLTKNRDAQDEALLCSDPVPRVSLSASAADAGWERAASRAGERPAAAATAAASLAPLLSLSLPVSQQMRLKITCIMSTIALRQQRLGVNIKVFQMESLWSALRAVGHGQRHSG